ncbi:type VI secretion system Vgr family protein [Thiocapsa sp. UBA6158]|jgi:type VI secretion system secreted protein VgrG|uniref:type VI secretion system Vgr family protein n=1 Tax=Thiocapsa sp. UBA6158 TaxID=1947692 RepID=UPI0025E19C31|nr:type VI secretion system tip protein VgrG [Thiocapsa sp. UBA6158]
MLASQSNRSIGVDTVLGPDVLVLAAVKATERLSQPFEYDLELLSERIDVSASELLGTPATVSLQLVSGERRYFNGYIRSFSQVGFEGTFARYRANLAPWLWFLSRTADCRIFQEQNVPDIVKSIFREHGFSDFEERLSASYRQWTYCVQYRETDLNFIQRLLEHEGIYYFHEHQDGKHTLVLADSYSAHSPAPGYEEVVFYPPGQEPVPELERIDEWSVSHEVRSGVFAHTAFDFTVPRKDLLARRSAPKDHALAEEEVFDFQNDYTDSSEGDGYARIRLEERQADHEVARAAGNARGLTCGGLFTLKEHPRSDQNREYLILSASYRLQSDDYGSVDAAPGECPVYRCRLTAIDAQVPYRPPCRTPKPLVQGPQTAIVVGKSGEEIWTDQYGRVKVQFHWDRYGKEDENSSCWVRVSHPWAGKNWGAVALPRIGQEVVVSFLEGDPDRPLITGRVYNGDCMPPYDLPANQTQSGIKSRSSKGGGGSNFNEIRMEDKIGEEELFIHAERNQTIEVEADESHWVGHDRTKRVDNDETTTIGNNRTESVSVDETIDIGANRTESVGANEDISIGANRTESVGANEDISIGANRTESVGANESVKIGASRTLDVGASETVKVGASRTEQIGASLTQTVGGSVNLSSGGPFTINALGGMTIIAPGGTKIFDKELWQTGGTIGETYSFKLAFNGSVNEATAVKAEVVGSANSVVLVKFEKVAADLGAKDVVQQSIALEALSTATGIEMDTLKIFL